LAKERALEDLRKLAVALQVAKLLEAAEVAVEAEAAAEVAAKLVEQTT
jgi:hypothetical protein